MAKKEKSKKSIFDSIEVIMKKLEQIESNVEELSKSIEAIEQDGENESNEMTAVEEFGLWYTESRLNNEDRGNLMDFLEMPSKLEEFKSLEKTQIINAYIAGYMSLYDLGELDMDDLYNQAEEYYVKTYYSRIK